MKRPTLYAVLVKTPTTQPTHGPSDRFGEVIIVMYPDGVVLSINNDVVGRSGVGWRVAFEEERLARLRDAFASVGSTSR